MAAQAQDQSVWKVYQDLIGIPQAPVLAKESVHTDLSAVLSHGFAPIIRLDNNTPGTAIPALHESFKTVLIATNSSSLDDYVYVRVSEALQPGRYIPDSRAVKTAVDELDRLMAMQRSPAMYRFPAFQLGVLTFTQDGTSGQLSAVVYERDSAACTVWIFRDVRPRWSDWYAFGELTESDKDGSILIGRLHQAENGQQGVNQEQGQHGVLQQQDVCQEFIGFSTSNTYTAQRDTRSIIDALFSAGPNAIHGAVLLELAKHYSNKDLTEEIDKRWPGKLKHINVLTKRLSAAIRAESNNTGLSPEQIRINLALARRANGVKNKAKIRLE